MNLMEARKEKLKSELLSLANDPIDPNIMILPIPEKMDDEDFVRRLQEEKEKLRYEEDKLLSE
jgi:hypothetical protein